MTDFKVKFQEPDKSFSVEFGSVINLSDIGQTYILVDEDGREVVGVVVDNEVVFTATANDIRAGTVAATAEGVTVGEKIIPSYYVHEGYRLIPSGREAKIPLPIQNGYEFTKLQAIVCPYTGSIAASVAADKVAIDSYVYTVQSTDVVAVVSKDNDDKAINLGFTNNSGSLCVVRYFTYKEIY